MSLMSKSEGGGGSFEPVPVGSHIARCVTVVDLGFQETKFGKKEQVYIGFEVPNVRVEWTKDEVKHEGPAIIGTAYTNSIHEKSNLGQHLVSWRGLPFTEKQKQGFDLFTVLDVPCMISVVHNVQGDKVYANISAIMGIPKGTPAPNRETDILAYSPQDSEKAGNFDKLPEWLQKKCSAGHKMADSPAEYGGAPPVGDDDFDDDIPF